MRTRQTAKDADILPIEQVAHIMISIVHTAKITNKERPQAVVLIVLCTVYCVLCTVYSEQCTVYSVLCTVYSEQ